ncbi:armadillo-type protein [Dimargaris cristalligena]|uniref:Armadillo-type protein n=1 Tax=Dimargaris cristalligena TaxID=215637 RepID=A0A4P9ZTJ2_9FUNG|nr:armadillo-type protein [Dimargaris cristalligena]|eukprot:RKP36795.1 armadillo-type protein [Dimargaris cristalligena]
MASSDYTDAAQHLQPLLVHLASNDNALRTQAEESLNKEWVLGQPDTLVAALVQIMKSNPDVLLRSFSAILFRRVAFRLTSQDEQNGALALYQNIQPDEPNVLVVHKLSDTVSEVARYLVNMGQDWPELLQTLAANLQAQSAAQRAAVFRIFASVPELPSGQSLESIKPTYGAGLQDADSAVRLAAVQACAAYLAEVDEQTRGQCNDWIPAMLNTLQPLLASGDETRLVETFTALVELAEHHAKPFRPVLSDIMAFCVQVCGNTELEDSTRQTALELPLTLAEANPGMARKTPNFCESFVPVALAMMTELDESEEDKSWYTVDNLDNDDDDAEANYCLGEQAMDRLARALGGKYVLPISFNLIPTFLGSPKWPQRHAGLMAISAIGEGCAKPMERELGSILQLVVPYFKDPHPRVRYAACNCVGQLSTDFPSTIQPKYHELVLSHLIPALQDPDCPRVQAHAAAALVNFCEEATQAVLEPYLDTLLENLLTLLKSPLRYVQEQAVTSIATVADSAEQKFVKYYSTIMPMLLNVIEQAAPKEYRMLRGKTIECATLIALAVGKNTMGPHAEQLVQLLSTIQQNVTEADDPQIAYLLAAWARMCKVMENDFAPYLSVVMPPLLRSASLKPDFAVLDLDEDADSQYSPEDGWEFVTFNGKQIGMRTSYLEEKCTAVEMLICYARQLGAGFQPYADQILEIVLPLLKFHFHEGVKTAAAHTLPQVLGSIYQHYKLISQQGQPQQTANAEQYVVGAWTTISTKLLNAMFDEADPFFGSELYTSFTDCLTVLHRDIPSGPNPPALQLNAENLDKFVKGVLTQSRGYCNRSQERREERAGQEDYDPEEGGEMEELEGADESLMAEVAKAIQKVFVCHGPAFLPHFDQLVPMVLTFLQDAGSSSARQWAICVFDDLIEFTGPASWNYHQHFLPSLLAALSDPELDIRQAAVYGIGVAAQYGGPAYADACAHAVPHLMALLNGPEAQKPDHMYVYDNAIAALAKIARYNSSRVDQLATTVLPLWLSHLPILHDEEECPAVYEYLLELLDQRHPVVMGGGEAGNPLATPTPAAVTRLVEIFAQFLAAELTVSDALLQRIVQAFQHCLAACPDQIKTNLWATMSDHQRKVLAGYGWA